MGEEFDNFVRKVDELNLILKDMQSKDPNVATKASEKAAVLLQNMGEKQFDENELKVKTNKTVINKKAFQDDTKQQETMSPEAFMAEVERDAAKRAADKKERKEIADTYKKKGNDAFRAKEYEKALDFYTKAIEKIKDSILLYTNRALTCLNLELYSRVISDCEWAHKLNEKNLKAWLYKAKAYHELGESDKASDCIREAEIHNPDQISCIQGFILVLILLFMVLRDISLQKEMRIRTEYMDVKGNNTHFANCT